MKQKMILLILIGVLGTACVPVAVKRTPELPKPRVFPEVDSSLAIQLVASALSQEQYPKRTARALKYAEKKFPYLSTAAECVGDPDYTIELSVSTTSEDSNMELAGLFMLLIPAFSTNEISVRATVLDVDGRSLGVFHASGSVKYMIQIHMAVFLPIAAPLYPHTQQKLWNKTFRDALIQAGEAITDDRGVLAAGLVREGNRP